MATLRGSLGLLWKKSANVYLSATRLAISPNKMLNINALISYKNSVGFFSDNFLNIAWGTTGTLKKIINVDYSSSNTTSNQNTKVVWGVNQVFDKPIKITWGKSLIIFLGTKTITYKVKNVVLDKVSKVIWEAPNNLFALTTANSFKNKLNQLDYNHFVTWGHADYIFTPYVILPAPALGSPANKIIIPAHNTHNTHNEIKLVKLPERSILNVLSANISTSIDSWAWNFKLTIANEESFNLLRPDSVIKEFEISINNEVWIGIAEKYTISTVFGKKSWTITGRSLSAYLSEPYAATQNFTEVSDKTNQQIVDVILENAGWMVDWKTSVYLVPANTYTVGIKSPINAIIDVAKACGAVVNSDPSSQKLIVQPRYLNSPANWSDSNSNIELSDSYLASIDSEEFIHKSPQNKIYCIGKNNGVIVGVKIIGTAGNVIAPQFSHALMTHVDAGREKGRNYFDEIKNNVERFSITCPFIETIRPGKLIKIIEDSGEEWFAQVTGIDIDIGQNLKVTHKLELERHYL